MTRRLVDATGTRRRLQALAALGHDAASIVDALGRPPTARTVVFRWRDPHRRVINAATARAVAGLYDALAHLPGPDGRARIRALKAGYHPPAAWHDLDIDDPTTRPHHTPTAAGGEAA